VTRLLPLAALALVACFAALPAQAQTDLTGTVVDQDGEPMPTVNVYLSGTTRGTSTDAEGRFRMESVAPGAYRVVASFIGYRAATKDVQVRGTEPVAPLTFRLEATVGELGGVEVQAEGDARWRRRFERFKTILLGESENAAQTTIENPWVLDFRDRFGALTATATAPLIIVNRALGYRLVYDLHAFEALPTRIRYDGDERFEPLEPADDAEAARWETARAQAYRGSIRHLLRSLGTGAAEAEGFTFMLRRTNADGMLLDYVGRAVTGPEVVRPADQPEWFHLAFDGMLTVTYDREPEVPAYLTSEWFRGTRSRPDPRQESGLLLDGAEQLIDPNGSPADPFGVSASGYLAFERLGDLVPEEYRPPVDGERSRIQARRPPRSAGASRDR
jgi:hypothetical protein